MVANPPCGVETKIRFSINNQKGMLLIHRVELKQVFTVKGDTKRYRLLIHRVELKLLAVGRLGFRLAPVVILALLGLM